MTTGFPVEVLAPQSKKQDFMPRHFRELGNSNDNNDNAASDFFLNADGEDYEPYSLAWRYLGMFIDCDVTEQNQEDDKDEVEEESEDSGEDDRRNQRQMGEEDNNGDDCSRKLLWAAYRDPHYKGGSIGEYQFFDWQDEEWDTSTCQTGRCARMDCHEPRSHWKLLGIFVESDGLDDWAEQLFKHEGVCVWGNDEDVYEEMDGQRQRWPQECTQMNLPDDNGNTLYMHLQPLPDGNLTTGMYFGEDCTTHADTITFGEYVYNYFYNYYGDSDLGAQQQAIYEAYSDTWNDYMMDFKYCQPCRAYSLQSDGQGDDEDGNDSGDDNNDNNDGEGEAEQWGYNCYDEAGYTNCNQCYKFLTKTDLYPADHSTLKRASKQGTMLRIKYQGQWYGVGEFASTKAPIGKYVGLSILGIAILGSIVFFRQRIANLWSMWRTHQRNKTWTESVKETLSPFDPIAYAAPYVSSDSKKDSDNNDDEKSTGSSSTTRSQQKKKINKLQQELSEERAMRFLEQNRHKETVESLEQQLTNAVKEEGVESPERDSVSPPMPKKDATSDSSNQKLLML